MVQWNLKDICSKKEINILKKKILILTKYIENKKSKLNSLSIRKFNTILSKLEKIQEFSSRINSFVELKLSENVNSPKYINESTNISLFLTSISNRLIFFNIWFKKISDKKAQEFIKNSGKYKYYLESIRRTKKYSLSEKEEKIINFKDVSGSEILTKIYSIIKNSFKYEWKDKEISESELSNFLIDKNKNKRHEAYKKLLKKYEENKIVLSEIYKGTILDWNHENIIIRGFKEPISVRNLSNDINDETIDSLIKVVKKNKHIFQKYFKLKAKILGEKKLSRYDLYAPINIKVNKKYNFNESKRIVLNTYKEFSEKAYSCAKEIFDKNHIHSEIIQNKMSGAFCATPTKKTTPYILLNFTNSIKDLMTLMHEVGHGIHGQLTKNLTEFTYHPPLPLAETASIFGETLLENKLIKEANNKEKLYLKIYHLDNQYASIMRQAYFVIFEIKAHKAIMEGADVEKISDIYYKTLKELFGNSINIPKEFRYEWLYIPHIFYTPFYCYAYTFGNLLGLSLYEIYLKNKNKFENGFLKVLSEGGNASPADILKRNLDIDISKESFWQKGFNHIKKEIDDIEEII